MLARLLERAPVFRSRLGQVYETPARRNIERFCREDG
jgi:hypothetical protein